MLQEEWSDAMWQREVMSKAASHYKEELISFAHVCFLISKKIVLITVTLELRMTFDVFADMT